MKIIENYVIGYDERSELCIIDVMAKTLLILSSHEVDDDHEQKPMCMNGGEGVHLLSHK